MDRHELCHRVRRAAEHRSSLWVAAGALAVGALVAQGLVSLLPGTGDDVEAARALGIVSVTVLEGYSKSADLRAYAVALSSALAVSTGIWWAWVKAVGAQRDASSEAPQRDAGRVQRLRRRGINPPAGTLAPRSSRVTVPECLLVSGLLVLVFARLWNARAPWFNPGAVLFEEGEALAWVDTVLRGRALSRDVFCLYGPLSTWAVALLFGVFGPSLGLWRAWMFALNAVALFAAYLLLRQLLRTRAGALAATVVIGVMCSSPVPAMGWSLSRVGLGLAALACLVRSRAGSQHAERWSLATGALLGVTLLYSEEVGIACSAGVGAALLLAHQDRLRALLWTAGGAALVLLPCAAYLAANASLGATIDNLILFPRVRLLGFGGFPFPHLAPTAGSLRAYGIPVILAVSGFSTATKLLRGDRDARTFADVALFVFGVLLFNSALSRPDEPHLLFTAPPALILLAGLMEDGCVALSSRTHRVAASFGLALGAFALAPWGNRAAANLASLAAPAPHGFRPLALPRGGGALIPDAFAHDLEAVVREIQSRTTTDEPFWVFPNEALLYFLADRPQPTRFPCAVFAVTRAQRSELIDQLERVRPHYTVLYRNAWPVDEIGYEISVPEVLAYLIAHYELDHNIGAFSLLRRRR